MNVCDPMNSLLPELHHLLAYVLIFSLGPSLDWALDANSKM